MWGSRPQPLGAVVLEATGRQALSKFRAPPSPSRAPPPPSQAPPLPPELRPLPPELRPTPPPQARGRLRPVAGSASPRCGILRWAQPRLQRPPRQHGLCQPSGRLCCVCSPHRPPGHGKLMTRKVHFARVFRTFGSRSSCCFGSSGSRACSAFHVLGPQTGVRCAPGVGKTR